MDKLFGFTAPDWRSKIPLTQNTEMRRHYQQPIEQQQLKVPYGRYGSNHKKNIFARGIGNCHHLIDLFCPALTSFPVAAPSVPQRFMRDVLTRTKYECEFADPRVVPKPVDVRSMAEMLANESIRKRVYIQDQGLYGGRSPMYNKTDVYA